MKTNTILIICFLLSINFAFAQGISINPSDCGLTYGYDAAGNRVIRLIVQCGHSNKTDVGESVTSQQQERHAQDTLISQIQVTLFPNPTSGKFSLDFNQALDYLEVVVVNANGQVMLTEKTSGQRIPLDISALSAGVYYVKLYTTKQEFSKIVVRN